MWIVGIQEKFTEVSIKEMRQDSSVNEEQFPSSTILIDVIPWISRGSRSMHYRCPVKHKANNKRTDTTWTLACGDQHHKRNTNFPTDGYFPFERMFWPRHRCLVKALKVSSYWSSSLRMSDDGVCFEQGRQPSRIECCSVMLLKCVHRFTFGLLH